VDLIEEQGRLAWRQLEVAKSLAAGRVIPIEIGGVALIGVRAEKPEREGRLPANSLA
jgi:hypothetical protein